MGYDPEDDDEGTETDSGMLPEFDPDIELGHPDWPPGVRMAWMIRCEDPTAELTNYPLHKSAQAVLQQYLDNALRDLKGDPNGDQSTRPA